MNRICLLLSFLAIGSSAVFAQNTVRLSGKILTDDQGALGSAIIYVSQLSAGTTSDSLGRFQLTLPAGKQDISISYIGYTTQKLDLFLSRDTVIKVKLKTDVNLKEVTIVKQKQMVAAMHEASGIITLRKEDFNSLPAFLGENDPMRAVQMQPGVQSGNEGARGVFVRGGSPDQNLMLVDGAPVYNPSHVYGFLSVFNGDAIEKIDVYKDKYPSRFGGRLCSVMDIRMSEGDTARLRGSFSLGLVTSRLHLEGPFSKSGKTTFSFSIRGCYVGLYSEPISKKQYKASGYNGSIYYYFGDLNAKVVHHFSPKTKAELTFFTNHDIYSFTKQAKASTPVYSESSLSHQQIYWQNEVASLVVFHDFNPQWQMKQHLSYSRYNIVTNNEDNYSQTIASLPGNEYHSNNKSDSRLFINDFMWRGDMAYNTGPQLFMLGTGLTGAIFENGKGTVKTDNTFSGASVSKLDGTLIKSLDAFVYVEDEYHPSNRWMISAGFHTRIYHVQQKSFVSFLPRVNLLYNPFAKFYLRASASGLSQNLHLLTTASSNILNDYWVPATAIAKPETGWNFSAGMNHKLPLHFEWSIDGFYRIMNDLIEYKSGNDRASSAKSWESQIVTGGKGKSYGAEFYVGRSVGRITGSVAYTLAWSNRTFSSINNGLAYPYKYDRRHNLAAQITFLVGKHIELSAAYVYGSGNTYSLPLQSYHTYTIVYYYDYQLANGVKNPSQNDIVNIYPGKNNARLPAYQHLDVSITYRKRKKNLEHSFNFSVYNVTNNFNIFSVYSDYRTNADGSRSLVFKKLSLFPVLPSLSYTIKFAR